MLSLGSDPEYLFKTPNGKFYSAENVFGGRMLRGKIGTDGHPLTAELRPGVFKDAISMTDEIQSLLRKVWLNKTVRELKLSGHAGSVGGEGAYKPLCGHIHFGIKGPQVYKMISYLDSPMLMLMYIEDYDENVRRRRQQDLHGNYYGALSSYRAKPHGFEYRCPSSWLVSPAITKGYLSLYHAIAYDYTKGNLGAKHPLTRVAKFIENRDIEKQFRQAKHDVFKVKLKSIQSGIKELTMYKQNYKNYQSYINTLLSLIRNGKTWNENRDIFETWGVKDKEIEQKALFFFQTRDYKIKKIMIPNLKLSKLGFGFPIRVFGLNDKKIFNISTNNDKLLVMINEFAKNIGNTKLNPTLQDVYKNGRIELGIGRDLRDKDEDLIKDLLSYIKKNHKDLIKR